MNKALFSSVKMDWRTPRAFFYDLDCEFNFGLDAAANRENAKCLNYFTPEDNGLSQSWAGYGSVFCNPPYTADAVAMLPGWGKSMGAGIEHTLARYTGKPVWVEGDTYGQT